MESISHLYEPVASAAPAKAAALLEHYREVRATSRDICRPLSVEDHALQPMPDASPAKWHLAHTTWFFETFLLSAHLPDYQPPHPEFRNFFNSYYNAVGDRPLRALRHVLSRPSLSEVQVYREQVDEAMQHLLSRDLPRGVRDLLQLGINHEQQHQELIVTDVKNGLWTNPLRPAYRAAARRTAAALQAGPLDWLSVSEGIYSIGFDFARNTGEQFAFDNEGPVHEVFLQPFRLSSRLVTNAEYLEFMRDDGYAQARLWLSDGWDAVRNNQWQAPLYWEQRQGEWWTYTMDGMQLVDPAAPVCHVSYYEADAFAHWAGARLATEFEWEVAARAFRVEGNFLESRELNPRAARAATQPSPKNGNGNGESSHTSGSGVHLTQMFGDVWEWTSSAYSPYPGFKPAAGAVGEYNGKFMCNQMVLRGGSCATPQSHIRCTYRNFFPPHVRWQFMGIRLANGS